MIVSYKWIGTTVLLIFLGYLLLGKTPTGAKPAHIAVFKDIPDDVWKEALKTITP